MRDSDAWFRPKTFGYGYTPVNAMGWIVTLAFVLLVVATLSLLGAPTEAHPPAAADFLARLRAGLGLSSLQAPLPARLGVVAAETLAFLAIARWKSGDA